MSSDQTPEELFGNFKAKADCPSATCSAWFESTNQNLAWSGAIQKTPWNDLWEDAKDDIEQLYQAARGDLERELDEARRLAEIIRRDWIAATTDGSAGEDDHPFHWENVSDRRGA